MDTPRSQANIEDELCQAVDYALNFEYTNALTLLERLRQENPQDVRPYLFKAVVYVQLLVNCKGVKKNKALFFKNMNEAERIGRKLAEKDKDDWYANFFLGAVHGWKAKYYLDTGDKWKTFANARKAKRYFEKAVKKNPDCFDAYYGLGVYHYYAGTLPRLLRFFLPLLNFEGDIKGGIKELNLAKEKGRYSRDFAAYELALIYLDREEKREEGLELVIQLHRKYPQNFNFQLLRAQYYRYLGEHRLARWTIDQLQSKIQNTFYAELSDNKKAECHLWSGLVSLSLNQNEKAQNDFQTALDFCDSDALKGQAHLLIGLSLHERERHQEAYHHYSKSLAHKDHLGSHHRAKEQMRKLEKKNLITEDRR